MTLLNILCGKPYNKYPLHFLLNSTEYLTASKTEACKQHCRLEPRNLSVFMQSDSNRTADIVVCHFFLLYRWVNEETRVIRYYIRDVINYLKKGFPSSEVFVKYHAMRNSHGQIPLRWVKGGKN